MAAARWQPLSNGSPEGVRRVARVTAVALMSIAGTVAAMTFWLPQPNVCTEPTVFYVDGCIFPDSLSVLLDDDQTRADLEAAIAPYRGAFDVAIDKAGIYSVQFPVGSVHELEAIMIALDEMGFRASLQSPMELYSSARRQMTARSP